MEYALLALALIAGLLLVPFGLPGTWVQVLGVAGYGALTDFRTVGWVAIAVLVASGTVMLHLRGLLHWSGVLGNADFWRTATGTALGVKLAAVLFMVTVSFVNRLLRNQRPTTMRSTGDPAARPRVVQAASSRPSVRCGRMACTWGRKGSRRPSNASSESAPMMLPSFKIRCA